MYHVSKPSLTVYEEEAVLSVIRRRWITHGPEVEAFEKELASRLGTRYVVACSSGTSALHLALAAAKIGDGDEVLVPDITYVASANAVRYVGGEVVLVDVDPITWTIDLEDAKRKLSENTRAIMPVHIYGVPCNMTEITQFALAHRLDIVEDAAEAVGASWRGRACGTIGDFGCFSFYGNKVITTGEGGAVICRSKTDYDRARLLRGQAQGKRRFYHEEVGFNYRLTDLQAAVGRAQLRRVDDFLQRRRAVCEFYRGSTGKLLEAPTQGPDGVIAPWMFTGVLPPGVKRDLVMRQLRDRGVETRPTFVPLHRLPMYRENDSEFPVACVIGDSGISLPTYPDMTAKDAENVVKLLEECIS